MFTHHSLFSASIRRLNQLLFVLLSSFLTHILKSKLLPFFSCCWLLHTGTTLHVYSPFFFSLRRSNPLLVVLLSCFLAFFLSSSLLKLIRLSFFSCCWLLCAGTIFFAYSPFSFFSLGRLNHTPFICRHRTHFVFSNTRAQLV